MVERPYKCTLCHASFRNESGMMWHVSRRHEAPQSLEALGKNYDEKMDGLRKDNATKAQEIKDQKAKLDDTESKLTSMSLNVIKELEQNVTLMLQIRNMTNDQNRLVLALLARDQVLQQRFGITLPSPFSDSKDNPPNAKSA